MFRSYVQEGFWITQDNTGHEHGIVEGASDSPSSLQSNSPVGQWNPARSLRERAEGSLRLLEHNTNDGTVLLRVVVLVSVATALGIVLLPLLGCVCSSTSRELGLCCRAEQAREVLSPPPLSLSHSYACLNPLPTPSPPYRSPSISLSRSLRDSPWKTLPDSQSLAVRRSPTNAAAASANPNGLYRCDELFTVN